jgi:hypothetical protein
VAGTPLGHGRGPLVTKVWTCHCIAPRASCVELVGFVVQPNGRRGLPPESDQADAFETDAFEGFDRPRRPGGDTKYMLESKNVGAVYVPQYTPLL